ncbi:intracellular sulfur oxidation DsrE/DsrF family protein [Bradyrhizobium sp. USDA 3397]
MLRQIVLKGTTSLAMLLIAASLSTAQEAARSVDRASESLLRKHKTVVPTINVRRLPRSENRPTAKNKEHRLILQVNSNDAAAMNLTLNNATNVVQHYKDMGEKVKIEVITFGPGLHMLRTDTSPVKDRIETMSMSTPEVMFKACGNTRENMRKHENKEIRLIPEAQVVNSGVVHIMEREEQGWTYVKP